MRIREYQAKQLLAEYGILIPRPQHVTTIEEAVSAAEALGLPVAAKARIHAGGRGTGGQE